MTPEILGPEMDTHMSVNLGHGFGHGHDFVHDVRQGESDTE